MAATQIKYKSLTRLLFVLKCSVSVLLLCFSLTSVFIFMIILVTKEYSPLTDEEHVIVADMVYNKVGKNAFIYTTYFLWFTTAVVGIQLAIWIYFATRNSCYLSGRTPRTIPVMVLFLLYFPLLNLIALIPVFSCLIHACSNPDSELQHKLIPIPLIKRCVLGVFSILALVFFESAFRSYLIDISVHLFQIWEFCGVSMTFLFTPFIISFFLISLFNYLTRIQNEKFNWLKEQFVPCLECGESLAPETTNCPVCGTEIKKQVQSSPV